MADTSCSPAAGSWHRVDIVTSAAPRWSPPSGQDTGQSWHRCGLATRPPGVMAGVPRHWAGSVFMNGPHAAWVMGTHHDPFG